MTRKSVLRSVRLDDDVWEAVKCLSQSLNQYLRERLLSRLDLDQDLKEFDDRRQEMRERMASSARAFKPPLLKPSEKKKI